MMYLEYVCEKQLGNINSVLRIPFYQADRLASSSHLFFSISRDRISEGGSYITTNVRFAIGNDTSTTLSVRVQV